jgi:hypothetical protein
VFGEVRWTEESEDHIAGHGVTPGEVEEVMYLNPRLTAPGRDESILVFGTTSSGRHLVVVVTTAIDGRDFVVTAREMTDREKRAFRSRRR